MGENPPTGGARDDSVTYGDDDTLRSFAGDGLAFSAKASSDMSPAGGGVAGDPRYATGPLPAASLAIGGMKQSAMWMFQPLRARGGDELVEVCGLGRITEPGANTPRLAATSR